MARRTRAGKTFTEWSMLLRKGDTDQKEEAIFQLREFLPYVAITERRDINTLIENICACTHASGSLRTRAYGMVGALTQRIGSELPGQPRAQRLASAFHLCRMYEECDKLHEDLIVIAPSLVKVLRDDPRSADKIAMIVAKLTAERSTKRLAKLIDVALKEIQAE
jgi:hypothetical protein